MKKLITRTLFSLLLITAAFTTSHATFSSPSDNPDEWMEETFTFVVPDQQRLRDELTELVADLEQLVAETRRPAGQRLGEFNRGVDRYDMVLGAVQASGRDKEWIDEKVERINELREALKKQRPWYRRLVGSRVFQVSAVVTAALATLYFGHRVLKHREDAPKETSESDEDDTSEDQYTLVMKGSALLEAEKRKQELEEQRQAQIAEHLKKVKQLETYVPTFKRFFNERLEATQPEDESQLTEDVNQLKQQHQHFLGEYSALLEKMRKGAESKDAAEVRAVQATIDVDMKRVKTHEALKGFAEWEARMSLYEHIRTTLTTGVEWMEPATDALPQLRQAETFQEFVRLIKGTKFEGQSLDQIFGEVLTSWDPSAMQKYEELKKKAEATAK